MKETDITEEEIYNSGFKYGKEKGFKEGAKQKEQEILQILNFNPYLEDVFPKLSKEDLVQVNCAIVNRCGFPLDRLSAHISREIREGMKEEIKNSGSLKDD